MKNTIVLIVLLTVFTSQAQERKFHFGANLFPNFSTGLITNNGKVSSTVESSYKGLETWKPSFSGNLFVEYFFNQKSILGFGIGYQNNGERTKKMDLVFGTPLPSLPIQSKFIYNHHNIELPVYYRYVFGKRFFVLAGISGIINISNTKNSILYYEDGRTESQTQKDNTTNFRRFNLSINLGLGIDYLKREKISLFVYPYAQLGILGISKTANLNRYSFSLGITTGFRI